MLRPAKREGTVSDEAAVQEEVGVYVPTFLDKYLELGGIWDELAGTHHSERFGGARS